MNDPSIAPAYADHNFASADILFVLREAYREAAPFLLQEAFDALAENYAAEEPQIFWMHWGRN